MKVLIVEDEHNTLDEIQSLLAQIDRRAVLYTAKDAASALTLANEHDFEGAFLDIRLPQMSGMDLADRLLEIEPLMTIVFITAFNNYATEAFERNAIDYLLKPVRPERLAKAYSKMTEKAEENKAEKYLAKKASLDTFGGLRLYCDEEEVEWGRSKNVELFSYLLMQNGKFISKEKICEELWPSLDYERALPNLQVTVHRLRKTLSCFDRKTICIKYKDGYYSLEINTMAYDVYRLEALANEKDPSQLNCIWQIYRGPFLEGKSWIWLETERERLRRIFEQTVIRFSYWQMTQGDHRAVEMNLNAHIKKGLPGDDLIICYLKAVALSDSKSRLDKAYKDIQVQCLKTLDTEISEYVEKAYHTLLKESLFC